MSNNIVKQVENSQIMKKLSFRSGDSVIVSIWVLEGNKKRSQVFDGTVISVRRRGLSSTFTVRKHSYGEGVERIFPLYSPMIKDVVVKRYGKVHQSKLYYLRYCTGKHARIKERL